jgi:hypothetical protein
VSKDNPRRDRVSKDNPRRDRVSKDNPRHERVGEGNPPPPKELEAAMRNALNDAASPTATEVLDAAVRLLDSVLRTDCETRSSALDLLTVDALMTRALEIACRDPILLEEFPEQAMLRIANAK